MALYTQGKNDILLKNLNLIAYDCMARFKNRTREYSQFIAPYSLRKKRNFCEKF